MTYYVDLTPYEYGEDPVPGGVNIGWLSHDHPFPRGVASKGLVSSLMRLAAHPENRYRGYHHCDLCPSLDAAEKATRCGDLFLGNGEIRIRDGERVYVAPTLIVHYIAEHSYRPPDEFIAAALGHLSAADTGEVGES